MAFTTDDLAAWRGKQSQPNTKVAAADDATGPSEAIRFSLRELLIAVTVIAVLLGLLRALGIFGAVSAFLVTAGFTWILYPKLKPRDLRGQQAMFDFLWGVGMPLVCLVFDPFVFKEASPIAGDILGPFAVGAALTNARVYDHAYIVYAFLACQMLVLTVWLLLGAKAGILRPLFGGFLASGLMFAALVGLVLIVPGAIGAMFLGIGLLGLTPILTAYSYGRQCHRALASLWRLPTEPHSAPLAVAGFFISVIVPLLMGLALLAALRGPEAINRLLLD